MIRIIKLLSRKFQRIRFLTLNYNRFAYPPDFGFAWRSASWRSKDSLSHPTLPRVELYYDYAFRSYVSDLACGEVNLFGIPPTHPFHKPLSSLVISFIWIFGSGYRFMSPYSSVTSTNRKSSSAILEFSQTKGLYDIYSPLALFFYVYFILLIIIRGPSELHYRLNPTFYLYASSLDLDRLPYNGFRFTPDKQRKLVLIYRDKTPAFSEDDQRFVELSAYYGSWWGRIDSLIWLCVFVPIALPAAVVFHFFVRPTTSYLVWGWFHVNQFIIDRQLTHEDPFITEIIFQVLPLPLYSFFHNVINARVGQLRSSSRDFVPKPRPKLGFPEDDLGVWQVDAPWTSMLDRNRFFFSLFHFRKLKAFISSRVGRGKFFDPFFILRSIYFFWPKRWFKNFYRNKVTRQADLSFRAWVHDRVLNPLAPALPNTRVNDFRAKVYTHDSLIVRVLSTRDFGREKLSARIFYILKKISPYLDEKAVALRLSRLQTLAWNHVFTRGQRVLNTSLVSRVLRFTSRLFPRYDFYYHTSTLSLFAFQKLFYFFRQSSRPLKTLLCLFFRVFFSVKISVSSSFFSQVWVHTKSIFALSVRSASYASKAIWHVIWSKPVIYIKFLAYRFFNLNSLFIHVFPQLQHAFGSFSNLLRKYFHLSNYLKQLTSVRNIFSINHNYTAYDGFFIGDDEFDFVYSGGEFVEEDEDWDELESYSGFHDPEDEDLSADTTDGAFAYSELYGTAGNPRVEIVDEEFEPDFNYHVDMDQHSPLLDRRLSPSTDFFDSSTYDEIGLEYYFLLYYVISISPFDWAGPRFVALDMGDDRYTDQQLQLRENPEDYHFEMNSLPSVLLFDRVGTDHGNTQLTVSSFSQLTSLSTRYQSQLNRWDRDRVPDSFSSEVLKALEKAGFENLSGSIAKSLTKRDWFELTHFVHQLTSPEHSGRVSPAPLLDYQRIGEIWETFADHCKTIPQIIIKRIEESTRIPAAFENHFNYPVAGLSVPKPAFKTYFDKFFRFLLGESYASSILYSLTIDLDLRLTRVLYDSRWYFSGDARVLRAIQFYFSGFITHEMFLEATSRLTPSPASILAISSYLRRLAIIDFDRFRICASGLSDAGPMFTLIVLSLSDLKEAPLHYVPASGSSPRSFAESSMDAESAANPSGSGVDRFSSDVNTSLGFTQRNKLVNFYTTVPSARHPLATLPFFFVSDFFRLLKDDIPSTRKSSRFPFLDSILSKYRFRDYVPYQKREVKGDSYEPRSYDFRFGWAKTPRKHVFEHPEFGVFVQPKLYAKLLEEQAASFNFYEEIFEELFDELDGTTRPPTSKKNIFTRASRIRIRFRKTIAAIVRKGFVYKKKKKFKPKPRFAIDSLSLVKRFTTRYLSKLTRQTTDVGLDYGEVYQSEVSGPLLSKFRDVSVLFSFNDLLTPPGLQNFDAWAPELGNFFNTTDADGFDLYDEPIPYDLEWGGSEDSVEDIDEDDERESAFNDEEDFINADFFYNTVHAQEHKEDLDNFAAPTHYKLREEDIEDEEPGEGSLTVDPNEDTVYSSEEIDEEDIYSEPLKQMPSTQFFGEPDEEDHWLDLEEGEEWQTDRFDLPFEGSVPLSRFFFGGLPTLGAFPATDPRLFLGPLSNLQARNKSSLHQTQSFDAAVTSTNTKALVSVSSLSAEHIPFWRALSSLLFASLFRAVAYLYMIIWDAGVRAIMHIYDEDPTVQRVRLQANVMLHYYRYIDFYSNKYYFKKFSESLTSWLRDFELYLDKNVRAQQYESFEHTKVFGSVVGPGAYKAYLRLMDMFPFRTFSYSPDGYFFIAPIEGDEKKHFPFELAEYLRYWYKKYHQGFEPDEIEEGAVPYESVFHYIKTAPILGNLSGWRLQNSGPGIWHFTPPHQVEKWSLYENERFFSLVDLPNLASPRDVSDNIDEIGSVGMGPYGGTYYGSNFDLPYGPGSSDSTDPLELNYIYDRETPDSGDEYVTNPFPGGDILWDSESQPRMYEPWLESHLDYTNMPYGGLNVDYGDFFVDTMGLSDPGDSLLFTYSSDIDFVSHLDEFENRLHVLVEAASDFGSLFITYFWHGVSASYNAYFSDPFHYWVVYSERFWLLASFRFGFWVNILRNFLNLAIFSGIAIYFIFVLPRILYYLLGNVVSSVVLLFLSGVLSIVILFVLPYFFFNAFYRFSNSITSLDKFVILLAAILLYFESAFSGNQPPGERFVQYWGRTGGLDGSGRASWTERYADEESEWIHNNMSRLAQYIDHRREINNRLLQDPGPRTYWSSDERQHNREPGLYSERDRGVLDFWSEMDVAIANLRADDEYYKRMFRFPRVTFPKLAEINPYVALGQFRHAFLMANSHFTSGRKNYEVVTNTRGFRNLLPLQRTAIFKPEALHTEESIDIIHNGYRKNTFTNLSLALKPIALSQGLLRTGRAPFRKTTFYAHWGNENYWRRPNSPISGRSAPWHFYAGSQPYSPRYDFRPTSFSHEPTFNSNNFIRPNLQLSYTVNGSFPRNRNSSLRTPDFNDIFLVAYGGHKEFGRKKNAEWERAKVIVQDSHGKQYDVMAEQKFKLNMSTPIDLKTARARYLYHGPTDDYDFFTAREKRQVFYFNRLRRQRLNLHKLYDWHFSPTYVAVLKTLGYSKGSMFKRHRRSQKVRVNRHRLVGILSNPFSAYFPYYGARDPKTGARVLDKRLKRKRSGRRETPGFIQLFRSQDYFAQNKSDHYYGDFCKYMLDTPKHYQDRTGDAYEGVIAEAIKRDSRYISMGLKKNKKIPRGTRITRDEFFALNRYLVKNKGLKRRLPFGMVSLVKRRPPAQYADQIFKRPVKSGLVAHEAEYVAYEPFTDMYKKSTTLIWPTQAMNLLDRQYTNLQRADQIRATYPTVPDPHKSPLGQSLVPKGLPAPSSFILQEYSEQPALLRSRYFDVYLQASGVYRRNLLNQLYTARFSSDDFTNYQYIYSNAKKKARDAHFTNLYAKNLRDYLLYYKPHSSYVFKDIYGPDPASEQLGQFISKNPKLLKQILKKYKFPIARVDKERAYDAMQWHLPIPPLAQAARQKEAEANPDADEYYPSRTLRPYLPPSLIQYLYDELGEYGPLDKEAVASLDYADNWPLNYIGAVFHYYGVVLYQNYRNMMWQWKYEDFRPPRMDPLEIRTVVALNILQRRQQYAFANKVFGDYFFHKRLLEGYKPSARIADFFQAQPQFSQRSSRSASPILDPYFRLASFVNPTSLNLYPSAGQIPSYVPYGAGHGLLSDAKSIGFDPSNIYNYRKNQVLHQTFGTTPSPRDRIHFNYLFDDVNIYDTIYSMPEDFEYFLTAVDTNEDYLGAVRRYERGVTRYINSGFIKNYRAPKDPRVPLPFSLIPYRRPHTSWINRVYGDGKIKKGSQWGRFHYFKNRYPIRHTGPFGGRNLKYYRLHRSRNHGHSRFHKLFAGLGRTEFTKLYDPDTEEDASSAIYSASGNLDRLLAISDYSRVQRLKDVYFSEYRKLAGAAPDFIIQGKRKRSYSRSYRYIHQRARNRRWKSFKRHYFQHLRGAAPGTGHLNFAVDAAVYSASPWYVKLEKGSFESKKLEFYDSFESSFAGAIGLVQDSIQTPVTTYKSTDLPALLSGDFYRPTKIVEISSDNITTSNTSVASAAITKHDFKHFRSFKEELSKPIRRDTYSLYETQNDTPDTKESSRGRRWARASTQQKYKKGKRKYKGRGRPRTGLFKRLRQKPQELKQ